MIKFSLQTRRRAALSPASTSFRFVAVGTTKIIAPRSFATYQQVIVFPAQSIIYTQTLSRFAFVGQTTSSTKLTDLTLEVKQRHETLTKALNESHLNEIMKYTLGKILQGYPVKSENVPAIHFRVFYQVMSPSPASLIINTLQAFKEATKTARIAFTVIPSCYLQNFGTFISICGIRHE